VSPNTLPASIRPTYDAILTYAVDPAIALVFVLGLGVFIWGLFEFLWNFNKGDHSQDGKKHMLYGIIGMFIMAGSYAIVRLIASLYQIQL
jgi:hypothetical protein